jgi:UDP-N-acetylmuramoylalanine--D-glutamate ligase
VFLTDESSLKEIYRNELLNAGIEFEEGKHTDEKVLDADEVVKSPGIPEKNEMVKR